MKQFPVRNSNCISRQQEATYALQVQKPERRREEEYGTEGRGIVVGITLEFSHIYLKFATHMHKQMGKETQCNTGTRACPTVGGVGARVGWVDSAG